MIRGCCICSTLLFNQGVKQMELYIHIPFCVRKCAYCDFLSFPQTKETMQRYVEKLTEEIRWAGKQYQGRGVSSVFIGGGTPSILEAEQMLRIMQAIHESFYIEETAEISIEANPGTVAEEKLRAYRQAGINRISFGLQSADDAELKLLGRIHTYEEFLENFRLARTCGFDNINVDLMSALPGQTVNSWEETLIRVAELEPEHISAYSLIIEEGTPFYEKYGEGRGEGLLPDEDSEREMYHRTKAILKDMGYDRYEISNYAKSGKECRHNVGYWTGVPYLGLGLGASSYLDGSRFCNDSDLDSYLNGAHGRRFDEQILTERDMQEEYFFVGLRLVEGVSVKGFEERFGVTVETVYPGLMERLVREGGAEFAGKDKDRFCLTEFGMDVSNYIMAQFLQD
ncbi:MAG: oxygen-independent coproporphyrinogen III oxidase [Lachnoclostridium sp.]|nr:oxygen-independent coproporphyrinogen III oxidase [Lachnoclostridium sp.]